MNVLFYEDPLTDQGGLLWRSPQIIKDSAWLIALQNSACNVRMLLSNALKRFCLIAGIPHSCMLLVSEDLIISSLPNPHINVNSLFHRYFELLMDFDITYEDSNFVTAEYLLTIQVETIFRRIISDHMAGFVPDIIITWVPAPHWPTFRPHTDRRQRLRHHRSARADRSR